MVCGVGWDSCPLRKTPLILLAFSELLGFLQKQASRAVLESCHASHVMMFHLAID
jgi:hypothetical protein